MRRLGTWTIALLGTGLWLVLHAGEGSVPTRRVATRIAIEPQALQLLAPGESATVSIVLHGNAAVRGFQLALQADPELVRFENTPEIDERFDFPVRQRVVAGAGRVEVAAASRSPVGGRVVLAQVELQAVGEGQGELVLGEVVLAGAGGTPLRVRLANGRIQVGHAGHRRRR